MAEDESEGAKGVRRLASLSTRGSSVETRFAALGEPADSSLSQARVAWCLLYSLARQRSSSSTVGRLASLSVRGSRKRLAGHPWSGLSG